MRRRLPIYSLVARRWAARSQREQQLRDLRFPENLERAFRDDFYRRTLGPTRVAGYLILLLYLVLGVLDATDPHRAQLWLLRYGITCPYLIGAITLSYTRWFRRWRDAIVFSGVLVLGLTAVAQFSFESDAELDLKIQITVVTVTIGVYALSRMRFLQCVAACWTVMAGFGVAMMLTKGAWSPGVVPSRFYGNLVGLLLANLVGMAAAHFSERSMRRDFLLRRAIADERRQSNRLLLSILPASVARRLKRGGETIAESYPEVTVLFADIHDFTPLAARTHPQELVSLLNDVFSRFDRLAKRHGLEKIKTIGDCYMAAAGLPEPRTDQAEAVARMALDMMREIEQIRTDTGAPLGLHIGIHTGPVVAGVIGQHKFAYDLWGDTVNVASRLRSHAPEGAIQISEETYSRVKDRFAIAGRREIELRGRGTMSAYLLAGHPPEDGAARLNAACEPAGTVLQ